MISQFRIEAAALVSIIVLIPLYLGIVHVGLWSASTYAVLGGGAITLGDSAHHGPGDLRETLAEIVLATAAVAGAGGLIYLLALAFL